MFSRYIFLKKLDSFIHCLFPICWTWLTFFYCIHSNQCEWKHFIQKIIFDGKTPSWLWCWYVVTFLFKNWESLQVLKCFWKTMDGVIGNMVALVTVTSSLAFRDYLALMALHGLIYLFTLCQVSKQAVMSEFSYSAGLAWHYPPWVDIYFTIIKSWYIYKKTKK